MTRPKRIEIGDIVAGKYRLLALIGEGGMGVVYLAEHSLIEKRLALKVLRPEYSMRPELVSRFQQEAISASRIKHPNVLDVFDFGQLEDGCFFLAMEHLSGRDLAAELTKHRTISPEHALRLTLQMCRALAAAHARGVVHRDLKPENVFLNTTEDGDEIVKIVDFGIAQLKGTEETDEAPKRPRRLTRTGMIFGTPEYMSPEQAKGTSVDLRCDIYALGVILYEMLTGAVPFTGTTFMAVLTAHLTQPVPPLSAIAPDLRISTELEQAILRCLDKDRDRRFQSMREFAVALQATDEGRRAMPLGGILPMPEVNIGSFRPERSASATAPEFGRLDPLPFDLVARANDGGRQPTEPTQGTPPTARGPTSAITDPNHATDSTAKPPRTKFKWALLLLALSTVGGGAVLAWKTYAKTNGLYLPSSASAHQLQLPADSDRLAPSDRASTNNQPEIAGSGALPPQATPEVPKTVVLTVQSNLVGATVSKDGFQVCDQTPCTVEVPRGAAVELQATKGYARGLARVLAQQNQTVNITLTFAKSDGKKKGNDKPGLCEVVVDGLKILRPCQ